MLLSIMRLKYCKDFPQQFQFPEKYSSLSQTVGENLFSLNTTGKAISPLLNFYRTTSRPPSQLVHYLAISAIRGNWLVVCCNSYGAGHSPSCRNSR